MLFYVNHKNRSPFALAIEECNISLNKSVFCHYEINNVNMSAWHGIIKIAEYLECKHTLEVFKF